jgi:ribosomal protein S18 acetylase RimI-like enzyme
MIKQIQVSEFPVAVEMIRASFITVAKEFDLTEENCPRHTAFSTTAEELHKNLNWGWLMYGLYEDNKIVGYVALSKSRETDGEYELHNLAVLPEYRHKGYGKQLVGFCKAKTKELGGAKIFLSFIEENTVLKNWYLANGFVHMGT